MPLHHSIRIAATSLFNAGAAFAEPAGFRFDQMALGCLIYREHSTGEREVIRYEGPVGETHVLRTYTDNTLIRFVRTTVYSSEGQMISIEEPGAPKTVYTPANCYFVPGDCTFVQQLGDRPAEQIETRNTAVGNEITSRFRPVGDGPFRTLITTLGPFNFPELIIDGDTWVKITKFENCGLVS
jgi:hypothetical protein